MDGRGNRLRAVRSTAFVQVEFVRTGAAISNQSNNCAVSVVAFLNRGVRKSWAGREARSGVASLSSVLGYSLVTVGRLKSF